MKKYSILSFLAGIGFLLVVLYIGIQLTGPFLQDSPAPTPSDSSATQHQPSSMVRPPTLTPTYTPGTPTTSLTATRTPRPSPTPTLTPTPTPTLASGDILAALNVFSRAEDAREEVLYLYGFEGSGMYTYMEAEGHEYGDLTPDRIFATARNMYRMSFANFLDLIAYVDVQGYFWIADITTIPRLLVFSGKDYPWDDVRLNWTPDDRHLIVEFGHPDYQDQIFHLESGEWETWDSTCDTVAHSPRTDRLAIWCYSNANKAYTIFEWGGEVWTSVQPPEQVLFIASPPDRWDTFGSFLLYRNAGWSSGGEMIAYYDPEDATGALQIVTLRGEEVLRVPEKAYWLTDFYKEGRSVPGIPLQWSRDSARLLLLGIGKPGQECPEFDDEGTVYRNPGCWQVLDLASGTVMWQATNLYPWQEPTVLSMHFYTNPTISGSGQYVAIDAPFDIEPLFLWDVETGEMLNNLPYDIEKMRWGRVP